MTHSNLEEHNAKKAAEPEFASEQEMAKFESDLHSKAIELMDTPKPHFFEASRGVLKRIAPSGLSKHGYINYRGFCVCANGASEEVKEKMSKPAP